MRTLVHLSDLHFGRMDPAMIPPLIAAVAERRPHMVIVSGDLTQRARRPEFQAARAFLDALPSPQIVTPGNHDVPLHNVYKRFLRPLDRYRRYITSDLEPFYSDGELGVIGINTARSFTIKGGRINARQIARACERLDSLPRNVIKIIVTHHPFDLPEAYPDRALVGRARAAMAALVKHGADMFLAGHYHVSYTGGTARRYPVAGRSALIIQAGTATSTRGRGEANSFNTIHVDGSRVVVERLTWHRPRAAFSVSATERFERRPAGWVPTASP